MNLSLEKINGLIDKCSQIKELYESDQQQKFCKDPQLIEIPEVEDNYKNMIHEKSVQNSYDNHYTKPVNPYKIPINLRTKPQKLYKSSLTKFQESTLTNSSMRVRAVEMMNSPLNCPPFSQIHSSKALMTRFFDEKKRNTEYTEQNERKIDNSASEKDLVRDLSITGYSNYKTIRPNYINEQTEFELSSNKGTSERKIHRPLTALHRNVQRPFTALHPSAYKENQQMIKNSPGNILLIHFFQ